MNIALDLSSHCIETEIRRQYNLRISRYFKTEAIDDRPGMETEIEMLLEALETFDFKQLRSGHPALAGGTHNDIRLSKDAEGRIRIKHNGNTINADYHF